MKRWNHSWGEPTSHLIESVSLELSGVLAKNQNLHKLRKEPLIVAGTHLSSGGSSLGCSPILRIILLATGSLMP
jgi:hypothetical protein